MIGKFRELYLLDVDVLLARLDLREIEHLVDERQRDLAGRMMVFPYSTCLAVRFAVPFSESRLDKSSMLLSGVRSSCDMLARTCGLVGADSFELFGFLLHAIACRLELQVAVAQGLTLRLELFVGAPQSSCCSCNS